MESSPTEAANSVDLAESTALTLVTHVLGFHKLLLGASTYNTDPLKEETDHDKKKKRAIDWDRFLVMFQSLETTMRVAAAELSLNPWGCHLLHIVCICRAPPDVVQVLLSVSTLPLTKKCGMAMEATPLHLACFFGCKAATVSQLLQADTDREALRMKDSQGRIPLHLACQNKGTEKESAKAVHLLLESDASKKSFAMIDRIGETPLQLACQLASKTVIEQLLEAALEADRIKENSFSMDDIPKQLPLHRAFHRKEKSPANVVHLLSTGPARANLTTKDRRGQVPFHIACENDPGASAFRQLIDNDPDSVTFKLTDVLGQSPMDVLIRRIIDGDDKVLTSLQDLARADEKRRFFGDEDAKSRTLLDKLLATFPSADGNKHVRLSHVERKALFVIATCTPPGSGKYTLSLAKCQKMLEPFTFKKIYSDIHFHKTLNNLMCKRSFTFYFMLDLFVRILLVVFFTISTNHAMDGNIDHWSFVLVYLCSAYLMAWQVKLVLNHQLFYFREVWNVLDLLTQVLVIVSVGLLNSGKENEGSFRALNVLVGGLVWFIIVTGALRSTFLPFSVFVSGFTMILLYMIPFGIITFLMLGAFAEMYFKSAHGTSVCVLDVDASDFCAYNEAFLKVYAMFVGGIDGSLLTTDADSNLFWISIFYAFLFSIVMLNVLVAVIFDAWGKVSPYGRLHFWKYRHQFLVEASESKITVRYKSPVFRMLEQLDEHLESIIKSFGNRPESVSCLDHPHDKLKGVILYLLEGVYLGTWFLLGLCSASILWPKTFRIAIFSLSDDETTDGEDGDEALDAATVSAPCEQESSTMECRLIETLAELDETKRQFAASQQQLLNGFRELKEVVLELRNPQQATNS